MGTSSINIISALIASDQKNGWAPLPIEVKSIIDGDTVELSKKKHLRLLGVNAPEKGEEGYPEAKKELENLIKGRKIFAKILKQDGYNRMLGQVFYMDNRGNLVDINAEILKRGRAHVFLVEKNELDWATESEYKNLQKKAQAKRIGIWALSRYQGVLHITSFHANGGRYPGLKCNVKKNEPPNCEYFRIANIGGPSKNLSFFKFVDCKSGKVRGFPDLLLDPGWSVVVHSGKGANQLEISNQPLKIHLGSQAEIWKDSGAKLIIIDPQGKIVDQKSSRKDFKCELKTRP